MDTFLVISNDVGFTWICVVYTCSILLCCFLQKEVADMCAGCERYIGTQGGGMDQAISFMAQAGTVS